MSSTKFNSSSNHGLGELGVKAVKLEKDLVGRSSQEIANLKIDLPPNQISNPHDTRHEEEEIRSRFLSNPPNGANASDKKQSMEDDLNLCSTSSMCPAPLCRQFWKAGNYDDRLNSKPISQCGTSYLRIHPKFLHSNATSHKWAFGALAELLDNSIDEIQNGATFVILDKTLNPKDGTQALLVQDDGGGMDPDAMRRCMSFGFSDKNSKTAIGRYGNGFKTSSMRLGADVVVFSRTIRNRKWTQSVGLLSYTFLMRTRQDRIVVPMVDYQFNTETGTWDALHNEHHLKTNLSILLEWSPFTAKAELLKQCDDIGSHGTKVIIYNLWHKDEGKLELDFESDPEDICISRKADDTAKDGSRVAANEQHLANRLQHSLRAYLSVLYLRALEKFSIILRGRVVEYHNIANDLKFPEFILYRPQNVEGSVITTIGFLKEAPVVNIHGFNVYHKNRLILPFWHVVTYADSRGRGVVGVLEANFIEPTHNKQDFEKTPVFQKLETRLKEMTQEYWDYHCGLIGYQVKKKPRAIMAPRATMAPHASLDSRQDYGIYQPVWLQPDSSGAVGAKTSVAAGAIQHGISASSPHVAGLSRISNPPLQGNSKGIPLKRKGHDHVLDRESVKRIGVIGSRTTDNVHGGTLKHPINPGNRLEDQEAFHIIQENKKLRAQWQEYEKAQEELNLKVARLKAEVREVQREYARLLLESRLLEKVKRENRALT